MKNTKSPFYILGVETSCDETAVSVIRATGKNIEVLSNTVSSQVKLHARWGGVVPNLAAREHLKNILPVLSLSLSRAQVGFKDIALLCVTNGPGLIPALLIGTNTAKTLAYLLQKPLLGIHHIEGHIYANFIFDKIGKSSKSLPRRQAGKAQSLKFPILCLVVSGGHTQLVLMKKHLDYEIVGQTLDDAAGEAFDKVARILKLGYPGGPAIAEAAMKFKVQSSKFKVSLPRPMLNSKNLDFSFSGLKTAVLYTVKKHSNILKNVRMSSQLCAEFQQAVIDVLIHKTLKAAEIYKPKAIMLAGGVSANIELRNQLRNNLRKYYPDIIYKIPDTKYSIDNAAMIAAAGYFRWKNMSDSQKKKTLTNWQKLQTDANLKL
ncbi:MAG: tRNA (adenosine(37)-N6)-threonylcarbamoyltransferase complex transferase subunit TsaD [Parcubacteria group bacterium]